MALRLFVLVSCLVASSYTAPADQAHVLTQSIVHTPTSHSSQLLLVAPQRKETNKLQPQYVQPLSTFQFPKGQLISYNPASDNTTYYNEGGPQINLIPLRQDVSWWQQIFGVFGLGGGPNCKKDVFGRCEDEGLGDEEGEGGPCKKDVFGRCEDSAESEENVLGDEEGGGVYAGGNEDSGCKLTNENKPAKKSVKKKHQMFKYKNQIFIVTGTPEFYRNIGSDKVSIQTLRPVYSRSLKSDEDHQGRGATPRVSDDPSVAQASPQGIAIAGVGGVASSKPFATAVVGDGGLAVASPHATAVAGHFFGEKEEEDKKKKD